MVHKKLSRHYIPLEYTPQKDDDHCGPAVLAMLFSQYGITVTQEDATKAAHVVHLIKKYGTRPDKMALGVKNIDSKYKLMWKQDASLRDVVSLIEKYKLPVGVNFQGMFYENFKELMKKTGKTYRNGDHGHYSIIVDLNKNHTKISLLDPYYDFSEKPRVFNWKWFKGRWHDFGYIFESKEKVKPRIDTKHVLFVVVPKDFEFPAAMKMQGEKELKALFKIQ
ncbi:hypothetical protein C5B42_02405 [Candidatus Cerribacteria bacterium 'Amazon FNV 2010 28 9']|uniref:Peptidase C39-like domain-containing protein n=1 Tax=Candidatus Cerribacteria bacterium 'Amazon FNV 2010 28 9' TaxID=2081795 RepID=A0A317JRQ7_9BACT|nr:MAG: hypothetical protein C5B42_02405 [Candidatus Cerribacteria bacterium 'Amazon FNV 2010 28 9']